MTTLATPTARRELLATLRAYDAYLDDLLISSKNCGTGSGGFKPGNTCGRTGGAAIRSPEQKERARKRFQKKLRKAFPFLRNKDIGQLTEARGDRESSVSLPRNQITAHEHDLIYGTLGEPGNGIRKPREIHAVESESKKWRLSATVSTNPMHGVMAGEKKYKVEYSAEGPNHQGHEYVDHFNSKAAALAASEKGHAELAKEYAPSLAPKTTPTVKDLFRQAGTTPARMEKLIYKQETPWHDVPHDQRVAWLANEKARIKNASKSAGKGEIRKGPHGAPIAWLDVDTRIAGKVRWGEWTAADERATMTGGTKAFEWVDVKASDVAPADIPNAQSILDGVLEEMGHTEAWAESALSDEDRRAVLEAVSVAGQAWLRGEAEALLEEVGAATKAFFADDDEAKALFGSTRAKVSGFFKKAGKYIRELVMAGVMAVTGPSPSHPQDAILQETDKQIAAQIDYLDKFKQRIVSEAKPLGPAFVARASSYGVSVWSASLEVHRQAAVAAGVKLQERRVLGPAEAHCEVCPELAARGWVKIGTLPKLGSSPCINFCRCHFEFR